MSQRSSTGLRQKTCGEASRTHRVGQVEEIGGIATGVGLAHSGRGRRGRGGGHLSRVRGVGGGCGGECCGLSVRRCVGTWVFRVLDTVRDDERQGCQSCMTFEGVEEGGEARLRGEVTPVRR